MGGVLVRLYPDLRGRSLESGRYERNSHSTPQVKSFTLEQSCKIESWSKIPIVFPLEDVTP